MRTFMLLSRSLRNRRQWYLIRSRRVGEMSQNKWQIAQSHKSCSKSVRIHFNKTMVLTKLYYLFSFWVDLASKRKYFIISCHKEHPKRRFRKFPVRSQMDQDIIGFHIDLFQIVFFVSVDYFALLHKPSCHLTAWEVLLESDKSGLCTAVHY